MTTSSELPSVTIPSETEDLTELQAQGAFSPMIIPADQEFYYSNGERYVIRRDAKFAQAMLERTIAITPKWF